MRYRLAEIYHLPYSLSNWQLLTIYYIIVREIKDFAIYKLQCEQCNNCLLIYNYINNNKIFITIVHNITL